MTVNSLGDYLNLNRDQIPFADDIIGNRVCRFAIRDGDPFADVNYDRCAFKRTEMVLRGMEYLNNGRFAGAIAAYLDGMLLHHGPKVFRPTPDECDALAEIELSLPLAEYAQPFPAFQVEYPHAWRARNAVEGESGWQHGGHVDRYEV